MVSFITVPQSSKNYASETNAKKAIDKVCKDIQARVIIIQREDLRYSPVIVSLEFPQNATVLAGMGFFVLGT